MARLVKHDWLRALADQPAAEPKQPTTQPDYSPARILFLLDHYYYLDQVLTRYHRADDPWVKRHDPPHPITPQLGWRVQAWDLEQALAELAGQDRAAHDLIVVIYLVHLGEGGRLSPRTHWQPVEERIAEAAARAGLSELQVRRAVARGARAMARSLGWVRQRSQPVAPAPPQ